MKCLRIQLVILSLLGLMIGPATAAEPENPGAWDHVTVTTVDGTAYEDVTVTWALEGYSLKLTDPQGEVTQLNPTRVVTITDRDGIDITNRIAAASPADDTTFALLGDSRVTPFSFGLMLTLGGSGTMAKGEGSFHFTGAALVGARWSLNESTHLHLLYRRQGVVEEAHGFGGTISTNANEIHLLYGIRLTHPRRNNNYSYIEFGLSVIHFENRFNKEAAAWTGGEVTGPGATIQGGLVIPLSRRVGLDLGGTFQVRPTLVEDSRDPGILFGLNAAVAFSW